MSVNVRYLLWSRHVPAGEWQGWLRNHTSLADATCRGLVTGRLLDEHIPNENLHELARALELADDPDTLRYSDLPQEGCSVLLENLRHLFGSLDHGGKKVVATELSVDPTTVSRWLNGSAQPHTNTLRQLANSFGLPSDTDLRETPIFLSVEPTAITERRRWLHTQIDTLSSEDLGALYPALRRMLEER